MKIIQSFWTKPLFADEQNIYQNRYNGGWINYRYCLLSMAYSCLTISKVYPELEIYTDDYGLQLLGEELCLPYKVFHADLNAIDLDPALWAYAKMFTYSLQQESFLHVDNENSRTGNLNEVSKEEWHSRTRLTVIFLHNNTIAS